MFEYIVKDCIKIGSTARTKKEMIREISTIATASPVLKEFNPEDIEARLNDRESISSTGLENGIAIPHCSFDTLESFTVGLIIKRGGIDFNSLDGKPTELFFFIIGPADQRNTHIRIISAIAKFAEERKLVGKLLNTEKASSVYSLLEQDISVPVIPISQEEYCQFIIQIQNEELFTDILEAVSADSDGTLKFGNFVHRCLQALGRFI